MDNLKQLQREDAEKWVDDWASAFWMAERLFGLRDKLDNTSINSHVAAVFEHLARSAEQRVPPSARSIDGGVADLELIQQRLKYVAYNMLNFAAHHFAFVLDSFHNQLYFSIEAPTTPEPAPEGVVHFGHEDFPDLVTIPPGFANYALRGVLGKISSDIMTMHAIWNQYTGNEAESVRVGLDHSNALSAYVLLRLRRFLRGVAHPIVYVRPSAGTRLMPYSNIPLIAIPPSAVINPTDSMAIPHELGHFLFWRGRVGGDRLRKAVADALTQPEGATHFCLHWVEEIFADVIAALIGGPNAVESLMALQQEKIGPLFTRDDGHYPIPAVRTYAALAVLSRGGMDILPLQNRWSQVLADWLAVNVEQLPQFLLKLQPSPTPDTHTQHPLSEIQADLSQIAGKILDVLLGDGEPVPAEFTEAWETGFGSAEADGFNATVVDYLEQELDAQDTGEDLKWASAVQANLWTDETSTTLSASPFGSIEWVTNVLETRAASEAETSSVGGMPLNVPQAIWLDILYFGGWGDAGPTGGSPHEFD